MAKYCCCNHFYSLDSFIENSIVKFREIPVTLTDKLRLLIDEDFTIKSVVVRVNNLGNLAIFFELNQLPGEYISPNVLIVKNASGDHAKKYREKTLRSLIDDNIDLRKENIALRHVLNRGLKGDFNSD